MTKRARPFWPFERPAGYILDRDHRPVPTDDLDAIEACLQDVDGRLVAETKTEYFRISTVFLCLRHNRWSKGPPMLFETMSFHRSDLIAPLIHLDADECTRYSSWDDAAAGHETMVRRYRKAEEKIRQTSAGKLAWAILKGVDS